MDYRKTEKHVFEKVDPRTRVKTRMIFDHASGEIKVQKIQDPHAVQALVDMNKEARDSHRRYNGNGMTKVSSIPLVEWQKIMARCGNQPGIGYDQEKFRKIINDGDYAKLRTVPGRI